MAARDVSRELRPGSGFTTLHQMPVEFIGSNPCATLWRGESRVGFVSLWEAEWSSHGPGLAVLAWVDGADSVRLLSPDLELAGWLAGTFSRHFPELEGLPPIGDPVECEVVEWQVRPASARVDVVGVDSSRVVASISGALVTRPGHIPDWTLGETAWTLTNLLSFCADATLEVDGARVLGRAETTGGAADLTSSAFVATYETWTRL